ncbi:ATP synthase protein I [Anaerolineae bacterium]|nr:ATP synthase protein I [Anaerolineae bacterium]
MRETLKALDLLFRLSALFLVSTFIPLLLGIWLDRTMGTAPLLTLLLMVSGIILGTIAVYRVVAEANQRLANLKSPDLSAPKSQPRDDARGGE